jgi:hypothetical protein
MGPWDPAIIGPIVGAVITLGITAGVASVMIFRPFTRQLGELLEQMRIDRKQQSGSIDQKRVAELMEGLLDRLERLEARQDFTEKVIESAGWRGEGAASLSPGSKHERRDRTDDSQESG